MIMMMLWRWWCYSDDGCDGWDNNEKNNDDDNDDECCDIAVHNNDNDEYKYHIPIITKWKGAVERLR